MLKVSKNKGVIFSFFSRFPFLKKIIFFHFCYEWCLFVSLLFFFVFKKNNLLPFLLEELLLIFCNNMIQRAVLMNKSFIFIYLLPISFLQGGVDE